MLSIGPQSKTWKIKHIETGEFYVLKIIQKCKFQKLHRKYQTNIEKYKKLVSLTQLSQTSSSVLVALKSSKCSKTTSTSTSFKSKNLSLLPHLLYRYFDAYSRYEAFLVEGGLHDDQIVFFVKQLINSLGLLHQKNMNHTAMKTSHILIKFPKEQSEQSMKEFPV